MFSKLTMAKVATPVNSNISAGSNQAQFLALVGGRKLQLSFKLIRLDAVLAPEG